METNRPEKFEGRPRTIATRFSLWSTLLISLMISAVFCFAFSISTSPFYSHYGYDSIIFRLIGKYWAEGVLPYVGLWDHKGPYIFFVNLLGYKLTGNTIGIFILQIIHLTFTIFFIFRSFNLFEGGIRSWLWTISSLIWLVCSFDEGNLTEEYLLPWIACVIYLTMRWAQQNSIAQVENFDSRISFLSGIILGLGLMTRLTNAAVTSGIILYVGLMQLFHKKWGDLFKTILVFCTGFFLVVMPFVLYFYAHQALGDMWFGTFELNFKYAGQSVGLAYKKQIIRNIVLMAAPFTALVAILSINIFKNGRLNHDSLLWLLASLPYMIWLISSNHFTHYNMIVIALLPVLAFVVIKTYKTSAFVRKALMPIVFVSGLVMSTIGFRYNLGNFDYSFILEDAAVIKAEIFKEEQSTFQSWGVHPAIYELVGAKPCYAHFQAQPWHATFTDILKNQIVTEEASLGARWQAVDIRRTELIQDILENSYSKIVTGTPLTSHIALYKRND